MAKLDDKFKTARATYLRYIRLRGDCANEKGTRWINYNDKLLVAEEKYQELGNKIKIRDEKAKNKIKKSKTNKKKTKTTTVIVGGNGKSIWDL